MNESRAWALAIAVIVALISFAGVMLQREMDAINARLDRVSDFVLAHSPDKRKDGDK